MFHSQLQGEDNLLQITNSQRKSSRLFRQIFASKLACIDALIMNSFKFVLLAGMLLLILSSEIALDRFGIWAESAKPLQSISCSSSADIYSHTTDYLLKSSAIMFILPRFNYCERKRTWTDRCMGLHSLAPIMSIVSCRLDTFLNRWGYCWPQ